MAIAPMAVRLTPHILSVIDWNNPLADRIRRQFVPLKSSIFPDHPEVALDSLHEAQHSPVRGLVHRYPDKVLFLGKYATNGSMIVPTDHCVSHLGMPSLLPVLYSVLCCWEQHRVRFQVLYETRLQSLECHARVH